MRSIAIIISIVLLVQAGAARGDPGWMGPESFLYPLKTWTEKFSLNFVFNQTEKDQKMLELAEERLKEVESIGNNTRAFERAMEAYADQLNELQEIMNRDTGNETRNVRIDIIERIENHKNRTKSLESAEKVSIIQQSIVKSSVSSGDSRVEVSVINGNVSINTSGGNATIIKDGSNVKVVSTTNNSKQMVIVQSSQNQSSSGSIVVAQSSSIAVAGN